MVSLVHNIDSFARVIVSLVHNIDSYVCITTETTDIL